MDGSTNDGVSKSTTDEVATTYPTYDGYGDMEGTTSFPMYDVDYDMNYTHHSIYSMDDDTNMILT